MISVSSIVDPPFMRDLNGVRDCTGKTAVYPRLISGESTGVICFVGQSLLSNSINSLYTALNGRSHNLCIDTGGMYIASDPQLGTDSFGTLTFGSVCGQVCDKAIAAGLWSRVIGIPITRGGTYMRQWTNAGTDSRAWLFPIVKKRIDQHGLTITAFVLDIGPQDNNLGTPKAEWMDAFNTMVSEVRALGMNAPWFVNQSTTTGYATYPPAQVLRDAQASVRNSANGIYACADTDQITNRYDGTHMNSTGRDLFSTAIVAGLNAVF